MIYERRYIQFNELVFDAFDMISDFDGDVSFKGSSTEYSYGHGSYRPFKRNYLFVKERNVSMTITLDMRKIPCDERQFYIRFVDEQLAKPGKLWCVKNNVLLWAVAAVDSISENYSKRKDKLVYNVNFVIPGGIWYKADKQRTFLVPWNICTFMECMNYKTLDPCFVEGGDCCTACLNQKAQTNDNCSCCCDDVITEDMALCRNEDLLQSYYGCDVQFRVVHDCVHAQKFSKDRFLGQKLCVADNCDSHVIAGMIYSETEIPTEDVTVIIRGQMVDPYIEINGVGNIIKGEYDGILRIRSNGDVYYSKDGYICEELLDPSVWSVLGGEYGWTIEPGNNKVVVDLNTCCQSGTCVWIQHEAIAL